MGCVNKERYFKELLAHAIVRAASLKFAGKANSLKTQGRVNIAV